MDVEKAIKERRALRSLQPVEISGELIDDLAEHAGLAPSCYNKQPWRFGFVYEKEMLEKLFDALPRGNQWARGGSLVIAVFSQKDLDCIVKDRVYHLFDTGMATAFLMLRATELELICHPIAGYDEEKVKELLAIPAEMQVITLLILGKKADGISPLLNEKQAAGEKTRPPRLPFADIAFKNRVRRTQPMRGPGTAS